MKRARQDPTVTSELLPSPAAGLAFLEPEIERPRSRGVNSALRTAPPSLSNRWGTYLAVVAFGAAVGATGYLAINEIDRNPISESSSYDAPAARVVDHPTVPAVEPGGPQASAVPVRLLLLRGAIANCEREGFLMRFACEQRARSQYCEGHWGETPDCPKPSRAEFGR